MRRLVILAAFLSALPAALLYGQDSARVAPPPSIAAAAAAPADSGSLLRPGDIIRLAIWREPDLSGDFAVSADGAVTLPKLGVLRVTDDSPATLRARLTEAYREYLRNPSIEVTLLRRVNVLGAVMKPGLYPVDPTMTLADALALAGGVAPNGNPRKVQLLRDGDRIVTRLDQDASLADLPLRSGDQLWVPERSWVSRNPTVIAAALTATVSIVIALSR